MNSVIKTIIALYSDEVTDYKKRFIQVSPKHGSNPDSFDDEGIFDYDEEDDDQDTDKSKRKKGVVEAEEYDEGEGEQGEDTDKSKRKKDKKIPEEYDEDEGEKSEDTGKSKKKKDKKNPEEYDEKDDDEESKKKEKTEKIIDYDDEDPIDTEKLDCQSDTNCVLLNNCLTPPNQSKPCPCINDKSKDKTSKKKACNILGQCKYKDDNCSDRKSTVAFSYDNFCEDISRLDNTIKSKKNCLKDKKIKKKISSLLKIKNLDKRCSNVKDKKIKDCLEILEEGKKCCVNYFEKKKNFFQKNQKKHKKNNYKLGNNCPDDFFI